MQQLQLVAYGEPSDVIELNRVPEPALGQEDVLVSMEAAPINPSDFMLVRGIYQSDRPSHSRWARRALAESSKPARRLTHWAEALWASWASRSRGVARLSSTPWTVGKSQPSRQALHLPWS